MDIVVQLNLLLKLLFTSSTLFSFSQFNIRFYVYVTSTWLDQIFLIILLIPLTFHVVYPRGTLTVGDMVEEQADSDDDDEDDDDGDEDCVDAAGEPAAKRIRSESVISVERGKEQGNNSEGNGCVCSFACNLITVTV